MLAGEPINKVVFNPALMAEVILRCVERHGHDSCSPITDYGLGTESMGSRVRFGEREQVRVVEFPVATRKDVARLRIPDPLKDGRMPVILECEQILYESLHGRVGVQGAVAGPLSFAANLRGPQGLLIDLIEDPGLVHELLGISLQAGISFGEAQIRRGGMSTIAVYDPMMTLISSAMADEFGFPYLERLFTHLRGLGAVVMLHICGETTRLLERMVQVGANILSLDVNVDLAEAKRIVNGRAVISGNVATQNLAWRNAAAIYEESCRCIERAAVGGRYTLSSSCEVPLETPPANIDAMIRAAREFGATVLAEWA